MCSQTCMFASDHALSMQLIRRKRLTPITFFWCSQLLLSLKTFKSSYWEMEILLDVAPEPSLNTFVGKSTVGQKTVASPVPATCRVSRCCPQVGYILAPRLIFPPVIGPEPENIRSTQLYVLPTYRYTLYWKYTLTLNDLHSSSQINCSSNDCALGPTQWWAQCTVLGPQRGGEPGTSRKTVKMLAAHLSCPAHGHITKALGLG